MTLLVALVRLLRPSSADVQPALERSTPSAGPSQATTVAAVRVSLNNPFNAGGSVRAAARSPFVGASPACPRPHTRTALADRLLEVDAISRR